MEKPAPTISRRCCMFGLCALALLVLRGSSCVRIARPYAAPTAAELVAAVQARGKRVSSLRAETRMTHTIPQGRVKGIVRLMAQRGGKLRFDAVTPFDTPLATLVSDGRSFTLVDARKNRHYHGPATPCNLARMVQVVLAPDDIITILGGSTPVIQYTRARVSWDERAGAEVLTLHGGKGLVQVIVLDGHDRTWDLLSSEVRAAGKVLLRIETGSFGGKDGLRLPQSLKVAQPGIGAELEVAFRKQEVNLELPAGAFRLQPAGGLPSQRMDCSTEVRAP